MGLAKSYPDWIPFFPNFLSKKDSLFFWAMQNLRTWNVFYGVGNQWI